MDVDVPFLGEGFPCRDAGAVPRRQRLVPFVGGFLDVHRTTKQRHCWHRSTPTSDEPVNPAMKEASAGMLSSASARTGMVARNAVRGVNGLDVRRVLRWTWYGVVAVLIVLSIRYVPWDLDVSGRDFSRYMAGAHGLFAGDPYTGTAFLYSPAWALLVSPLAALPMPLALALWRIGEFAALALAVRGQPLAYLALAAPWLWGSEIIAGNMMGFATAAMIAVVRWPSVRTVLLYAVLVALVPKPALLPVLAYGIVRVPQARRWVVLIGLAGMVMLLWPGYLNALLNANEGRFAPHLIEPWTKIMAVALTIVGLRWTRLLGIAATFASPYAWWYLWTPLALTLVRRSPWILRRQGT